MNTITNETLFPFLEQLHLAQTRLRGMLSIETDISEQALFQTICNMSKRLMRGQRAAILMPEPSQKALRFVAQCNDSNARIGHIVVPLHSIAGRAFTRGKIITVTETARSPYFFSGVDQATGQETKSVIALPLWRNNQIVGVLEVVNRTDEQPFDQTDQHILSLLGESINMTLSAQQQMHYLRTLIQVGNEISTLQQSAQLLHKLCEAAQQISHAEAASILLGPDKQQQLRFVAATGPTAQKLPSLVVGMDSIAGKSLLTGEPQLINQVNPEETETINIDRLSGFHTKMVLAVPIIRQDHKIGVFEVLNKKNEEPFNHEEVYLLQLLASQAAIAIENMQLNETREQTLRDLQDLDRRKDQFLAVTSHELRTPLTVIMGYSEFLANHLQETGDQEGQLFLSNLNEGVRHLSEMIEVMTSMHNLSQTDDTELMWRQFDITSIAKQIQIEFQTWIRTKALQFQMDIAPEPLIVNGNAQQLKQAISNLLSNAIKFTEHGGSVTLIIHPKADEVFVAVKDTGIGIPPAEQARIFDRFYQVGSYLTRTHAGLGLGLAIAQDIVRKHGGEIEVESQPGIGSTFYFTLPSQTTSPTEQADRQPTARHQTHRPAMQ